MFQIRIHGRGGQGVVTAAELLSVAAFADGQHSQAFPSFGSERTGAPVVSYCRISSEKIRLREPVLEPDALLIQDVTLLHSIDVFAGSNPQGFILINTRKSFDELGIGEFMATRDPKKNLIVPASDIALKHIGRPLPNAALLGGFAAATGLVKLESILAAIDDRFPARIAASNIEAAKESFEFVQKELEEMSHA